MQARSILIDFNGLTNGECCGERLIEVLYRRMEDQYTYWKQQLHFGCACSVTTAHIR